MLAILTGDGKGKTTSALGTALRAAGWNKKVLFVQFIKMDEFPTGEKKAIEKFLPANITIKTLGLGFVGIKGDAKSLNAHRQKAKEALEKTKEAVSRCHYDLVVLDEILGAIAGRLLTVKDVSSLLDKVDKNSDVVLTGRSAPKALVDKADLVSEIRKIKHPYDKGILAKKGFDF
ncbi:MAG: cob(I)yrinic acid a,c-diamide adenosyltransferase [Patescibacteria group bacterium]